MSGYFSPEGKTVTWRGQTAVYAPVERAIMRELPVPEQAVIHLLKALTQGDIREDLDWERGLPRAADMGASGPALTPDDAQAETPSGVAWSHPSRGITGDLGGPLSESKTYIDADEIVFGEGLTTSGKRKRPIYALVWTWRQHRIHKTKKKCEQKMRAWKRWYERQGWTVTRQGTGYWANGPQGERHAIGIHTYDASSRERIS